MQYYKNFCGWEYSRCSIADCRTLCGMGELPSEDRNNDRIWIRRIPFPLSAHLYVVFALPFEETYCEENKLRAAYTEGMYGLSPPSGCFMVRRSVFVHVGEWSVDGNKGFIFFLMIFWNYLYIIFQDLWTFPRTFFNYKEYQQSTPFLIPNRKSILVCLRTIRKK